MNYLFIVNEAPYSNEKPYNALRLAMALQREHNSEINRFFLGDSVVTAIKNQKTPNGYYNLERMINSVIRKGGKIFLCGSCMDARGMDESSIVDGAKKSTMVELVNLTNTSEKILTF